MTTWENKWKHLFRKGRMQVLEKDSLFKWSLFCILMSFDKISYRGYSLLRPQISHLLNKAIIVFILLELVRIKTKWRELERWLSSWEWLLLFWRIRVKSPVPRHSSLQLCVPQALRIECPLQDTVITYKEHTHINNIKK